MTNGSILKAPPTKIPSYLQKQVQMEAFSDIYNCVHTVPCPIIDCSGKWNIQYCAGGPSPRAGQQSNIRGTI